MLSFTNITVSSRPEVNSQANAQTRAGIHAYNESDIDHEIPRNHNLSTLIRRTSTVAFVPRVTATKQVKQREKTPVAKEVGKCPRCGKIISRKALSRHPKTKHTTKHNQRRYRCFECDAAFARKDILDRHQAEQHGDEVKAVQCPVCEARIRKRAIFDHFRSQGCLTAQTKADLDYFQALKRAQIASLGKPGRFDAATVLDPLFISLLHGFEFMDFDNYDAIPLNKKDHYWKLRGLAIRTAIRGLKDPTEAEVQSLAFALFYLPITTAPKTLQQTTVDS